MSTPAPAAAKRAIRSTIPARLDRLSWSPFDTRMVAGLGAAWILDGLQITIASSVTGGSRKAPDSWHDLGGGRGDRVGLPGRRDGRRAGVRQGLGPTRPQAIVVVDVIVVLVRHRPVAFPLLLVATAFLGVGFGLTVPALNTLTAAFHPNSVDRSVLGLNALLGLGTALAPVLVAIFVGLGFWWGLPVMSTILLTGLLVTSLRLPLRAEGAQSTETPAARRGIPSPGCSPGSLCSTGSARPSTATGLSST